MRKPAGTTSRMEDSDRAMLYEGCSIGQLSVIFGQDKREIGNRISLNKIPDSGMRSGYPIYRIADVAPVLVTPKGDIEGAIKKMSPKDLPPQLSKEFWAALTARRDFEENEGDLWRTADVIERMSEVFKTLRMNLLLMTDQVERQTQLTDKQRRIIQDLTDNTLNQLANELIAKFKNEPARRIEDAWEDPEEDDEL